MVNFHRSASGITARWAKVLPAFLILFFLGAGLRAQEKDPLSEKERHKFNELFFEAEKQMNLGNTEDAQELYEELYKLDPNNAVVCYEMAQIFGSEGSGDDAIFYAERAAELDPDNKWYQFLLASVYGTFGMAEKEIAVLKKLVELDTANPDYRYELAMAYLQNEQHQKAIEELNELEEDLGVNEVLSNDKKQIYLEQGDLDGAVDEIQKLIAAYPRNLEHYGTLAQMYMVNGYEGKALEVYEEMLKIDPEDARIHLDLAKHYQEKKQFEKSFYHLKKAMLNPELDIDQKVPVLLSLFDSSAADTNLRREAYEMLEAVTEQNPENPKAFAIYGDFLSSDGRNAEALKAYKKAVSLEGGNRFQIWEQILLIELQAEMYDSLIQDGPSAIELYPNQPLPYFFTGVAFNIKEEPMEAVGYLEDGLNYVLGNPRLKQQFYTQLADAYHRLGENQSSDQYFEKALALNSENPTVLNNYAYYLSERGEKLEKALQMTEKSNRLTPDNAVFLDTWAWVLYQKGNYAEALEKMEKVVQLGGAESGEVLEHYGDILYKNGQTEQAVEQWKKAQATGEASQNIDQKINSGKIVE